MDATKGIEDNKVDDGIIRVPNKEEKKSNRLIMNLKGAPPKIDEESASWSAMLDNPKNAKNIERQYNKYDISVPPSNVERPVECDLENRFSSYMNAIEEIPSTYEKQINDENIDYDKRLEAKVESRNNSKQNNDD